MAEKVIRSTSVYSHNHTCYRFNCVEEITELPEDIKESPEDRAEKGQDSKGEIKDRVLPPNLEGLIHRSVHE
jgi:hypothetical protein